MRRSPPRRARRRRTLGISSLVAVAVAGCSEYSGPGADLVVTVATNREAIVPGDTLEIHLEVINAGERADSIAAPGPDCPILWRIDGPGGISGGPNGVLDAAGDRCTPGLGALSLAPGEAVGITYKWTGERGTLRVPHELPLGRYVIRAATQPAASIERIIWSRPVGVELIAPE